jgi:hypothetical protein
MKDYKLSSAPEFLAEARFEPVLIMKKSNYSGDMKTTFMAGKIPWKFLKRRMGMSNWNIAKVGFYGFLAVSLVFPLFAHADDVTDSINEGLEYYQQGEHGSAVESLNYAVQLIQQMKGEGLEAFLPEPLAGWTAEPTTSQGAGGAMMGGGVTAGREYYKDSSSVDIQIISDSPMLQGMMMMFANPMLAAADGGKLEKINGEKAMVKYDAGSREGEIKVAVAKRFFVLIDGNDVSKEDLKAYAQKIDYKKLAALP